MGRKGLSVEEKRVKLLGLYHETKLVYNLKELEKAGSKTGVVTQTIKDINQELISDGLVDQDKIGSGNFYWSFPSKALVKKQNDVTARELQLEQAVEQREGLKRKAEELRADGRRESEERTRKLRTLQALQEKEAELEREGDTLRDNDPAELERIRAMVEEARRGANRWTDNTWAMKKYIVQKLGKTGKEVDAWLQMKESFDYV